MPDFTSPGGGGSAGGNAVWDGQPAHHNTAGLRKLKQSSHCQQVSTLQSKKEVQPDARKGAEEESCCHAVAQHLGTKPCLSLRERYRRWFSPDEVVLDFSSAPGCPRSSAKSKGSITEHSDTETYLCFRFYEHILSMESTKRCQREKGALTTPPPTQPPKPGSQQRRDSKNSSRFPKPDRAERRGGWQRKKQSVVQRFTPSVSQSQGRWEMGQRHFSPF